MRLTTGVMKRQPIFRLMIVLWHHLVCAIPVSYTHLDVYKRQVSSSDWKEQLREAVSKDKSTDSVILYFSTVSCTDCSEVKSLLKKMTEEQTAKKPLVIHEFNIAEGDNVVLLQKLFSIYDVAVEEQQVPIVFFSGGYLSGAKAVTQELEQKWKDDEQMCIRDRRFKTSARSASVRRDA